MMEHNIDDEMYRFIYEARCSIVEKQDEIIFQTISHIGGKEFRHITIDKSKVLEALTDYVRKEKNKADFAEVHCRCSECKHLEIINKEPVYAECKKQKLTFLLWQADTRQHFCSYGERKNNFKE